ncbi:MAG: hypothetical protein HXY50_03810 [Ignavibacteriaceae bacterium]|nr:hypothetical protein [Ignavibacteriaceae bacterium]
MVRTFYFIFSLASLFNYCLYSQTISARAYTDKSKYEVGDYITYSIEISHDRNLKVYKPILSELIKGLDVINSEEPTVEDDQGNKKIFYRYTISKYDSAEVTIPSVPIIYKFGNDTTSLQVYTNPVTFLVSTLPVIQNAEIKDVKPPISIPLGLITFLLIVAVIILLIALAVYLYRRQQKKKRKHVHRKKIYIIPPHVKALSELHKLDEMQLWQQGKVKEYHSIITEIIRRYFEERFKILALESSTTEIMEQLKRVVLPENIYKTVNNFLDNADLVKFAKYKPLQAINEQMMTQAIDIVENTVPVTSSSSNSGRSDAR